ncbi:MAG: T9SS type A sorting domain-containing protein [Flavobacteriales bacterium]|nr:T9SS type A sorting domain-containing protein [Flavobacteriales bacterium]
MLHRLLILGFGALLGSCELYGQDLNLLWAKGVGGSFSDYGKEIAVDVSGNVFVAGNFTSGDADFDPGLGTAIHGAGTGGDGYIAKYNSQGDYLWSIFLGAGGSGHVFDIVLDDTGNVYACGTLQGTIDFDPGVGSQQLTSLNNQDLFIAKYSGQGDFRWANRLAGAFFYGNRGAVIAVDQIGDIIIAGEFEDTCYFSSLPDSNYIISESSADLFIAKYSNGGNFQWAKNLVGSPNSNIEGVAVNSLNSIYITGFISQGSHDFDPGPDSTIVNATGTISDGYVAKYDVTGNFEWVNWIDALSQIYLYDIAIDLNGSVLIAGSFVNQVDMAPNQGTALLNSNYYTGVFAKYSSEGDYKWAKQIGSVSNDIAEIYGLAINSSGNIVVSGYFDGFFGPTDFDPSADSMNLTASGRDAYLAGYDSLGNFLWVKAIKGIDEQIGYSIAIDNEDVYVSGTYMDSTFFEADTGNIVLLTPQFSRNIFFAKYEATFTGVEELKQKEMFSLVYPNPAENWIAFDNEVARPMDVTLYDLTGKQVLIKQLNNSSGNINVGTLARGLYIYRVVDANGVIYNGKVAKR